MREQELLLRSLQQCDFTLYELQLYLDTHPNCKRAMEQYRKHLEMKRKAEKMYVEKYGPIRPSQSNRALELGGCTVAVGKGGKLRCGRMRRNCNIR